MYQCDKCYKTFGQKSDYERHMNRKIPCDAKGRIIINNNPTDYKIISNDQSNDDKDEIIK